MAHWTAAVGNTPAIATRKFAKTDLEDYAEAAGYYKLGPWLQELHETFLKTSREINENKVVELLGLECGLLRAVVRHKTNMKSEKFFHKVSQVARCLTRYLNWRTAGLLSNVAQLWPEPKTSYQESHIRLPSPALIHHLLLLMARSYALLQHTCDLCEEAAVWLQCKLSTGQRTGIALALFGIVSRVRAVSLYLLQSLSCGYDRLSCLLCGLPLQSATQNLHQQESTPSEKKSKKSPIKEMAHKKSQQSKEQGHRQGKSLQIQKKSKTKKSVIQGATHAKSEQALRQSTTEFDAVTRGTVLQGLPRHLHPSLLRSSHSNESEPGNDGVADQLEPAFDVPDLQEASASIAGATGKNASTITVTPEDMDLGEEIKRSPVPKRKLSDIEPQPKKKKKKKFKTPN